MQIFSLFVWLVLICSERKVLLAGLFWETGWWLISQANRAIYYDDTWMRISLLNFCILKLLYCHCPWLINCEQQARGLDTDTLLRHCLSLLLTHARVGLRIITWKVDILVVYIIMCCYLLSLYLSVKRSHHVRRESLEISTLIQKREKYTPLNFMKIWKSRLIKEYINSELK
jgi:hypothetical protein